MKRRQDFRGLCLRVYAHAATGKLNSGVNPRKVTQAGVADGIHDRFLPGEDRGNLVFIQCEAN